MRIIALLALLMLAGCSTMKTTTIAPDGTETITEQPGSMFGPSSFDVGYAAMYKDHEEGKTKRVVALADASACPKDNKVAQAYCIALGKMSGMVAVITDKFEVKAPTTGFDVLHKGIDVIVPVMGMAGIWQTAVAGFEVAGSYFGPGATVSNSLNRTTSASTAVGAQPNVTSSSQGTGPPAEVVKVDPLVITAPVQ